MIREFADRNQIVQSLDAFLERHKLKKAGQSKINRVR